ncbi:MAG: hypothetical protein KF773_11975 [Deltaproteobacteria bacterium]|nr:hypothetical protein [Deltaproteobacteria bacterium]
MRIATVFLALGVLGVVVAPTRARAGELTLDVGLQATTTAWPDDRGGGAALQAAYWFRSWLGASFIGKEHYAQVDDRFLSYFSVNAAVRRDLGRVRLGGTLGVVHQHEEPYAAVMEQPVASLFGVADGTRHRMGTRAGLQLAVPFRAHRRGDWYVALDVDATRFLDQDRGPGWMSSLGASIGFSWDFARSGK